MDKNTKKSSNPLIFIILIPLLLILGAILVDTWISYSTNKKFRLTTETILNDMVEVEGITPEEYEDYIRRAYERNDYKTDNLIVEASTDRIYVENDMQYSGIFSSLFYKNKNTVEKVIFGVTARVSENSKAFIKCEATYGSDGKLVFKYIK